MNRTTPENTKLVICVWHAFTLWQPPPDLAERIRGAWPQMRVVNLNDYGKLADELPDTDILVGFSIRREQFAFAKQLRWIHSTAAGVGQLMYPELRKSGIMVTNARGIHSVPMAEQLVGTIVAMARRFPDAFRYQAKAQWAQQKMWDAEVRPRELNGQTLLIVGFGSIGRELARRIQPMGMHIWGVTRSGRGDASLAERIFSAAELRDALPEVDFVVLAAPETPETRRMFGAEEFARMKRTSYFINVARGTLVDEAALAQALESRVIAGAALDVFEHEPLPTESPLWRLENVFITPHMSAVTERLWERQTELLLENLHRWFAGEELRNRVDFARGY